MIALIAMVLIVVLMLAFHFYQYQQNACLACGRQAQRHCWHHGVEARSNSCTKYSSKRHEHCTEDLCVHGAKLGARRPE